MDTINPAWEVHPTDVNDRMRQQEDLLLLDVRQLREWNAAKIDGAVLLPLHELPARIDELDAWRNKPVVILCHHGVRSLRAAGFLRELGFANVKSMAGGIEAWSVMVDPSVPRY